LYLIILIAELAHGAEKFLGIAIFMTIVGALIFAGGILLSAYRERLLELPDKIAKREGIFHIVNWRSTLRSTIVGSEFKCQQRRQLFIRLHQSGSYPGQHTPMPGILLCGVSERFSQEMPHSLRCWTAVGRNRTAGAILQTVVQRVQHVSTRTLEKQTVV